MANPYTVARVLKRRDNLQARFSIWHTHWQLIAEWLFTRKASFTTVLTEAEFLDRDMFDMTGPMSMDVASSAFIGMLWPSASESFDIVPGDGLEDDLEAQDYFEKCTQILAAAMDDPEAGLDNALAEYGKELLAFGNGAVSVMPGTVSKLRYDNRSLRGLLFDEGTVGKLDVIYDKPAFTVEQLVNEVGIDKVHENVRKAYNQGRMDDKLDIVHAILPRPAELRTSSARLSKKNMPYCSMLIDVANNFLIKEDGFEEPPIIVGRMDRYAGEVPGRGCGGRALPEIIKANVMAEAITLATEQRLDPALYVWSDMRNTVIDKSPGAVNVFRPKGQVAANAPAGTLFEVGSMQEAVALYENTQGNIKQHFYLDRLLDLNVQKQMTAYETFERKIIRSQTMKDPAKRQYSEFYTPLIVRSFNTMWRGGHLGAMPGTPEHMLAMTEGGLTVPDSVAKLAGKGGNPWKIRYKTPAMRELKLQSVQNNMQFVQYTALTAQALNNPDLLSIPDGEEILRDIADGLGVVARGVRSKKALAKGREQGKQQADAEQANMLANAVAASGGMGPGSPPALKVLQGGAAAANKATAA